MIALLKIYRQSGMQTRSNSHITCTVHVPSRSEALPHEYSIFEYIPYLSPTCPRLSEPRDDHRKVMNVENGDEDRRRRQGTCPDRDRSRRSFSIKAHLPGHSNANAARTRRVPSRSMSDLESPPSKYLRSKFSTLFVQSRPSNAFDSLKNAKYAFARGLYAVP